MEKTEVYSWRLDPELKSALESVARTEGTSLARLLDRIAGEWLGREVTRESLDAQQRIRARAMRLVGSIRGNDPGRSRNAAQLVKRSLARTHARRRAD
jgi:hypothetical protein